VITARRDSATERRGVEHASRRPTAILVAVTVISAGALAGCASKTTDTSLVGKPLPSNQDTEAALAAIRAAGGKAPQERAARAAAVSPSTTIIPSGTYTTDQLAEDGMQADLTAKMGLAPTLAISPPQPSGSTRAPLEIIDMPMWLWVDTPPVEQTVVVGDTITESVVIDSAVWTLDGAPAPWTTCAAASTAPNGAGVSYDPAYDPANAGNAVPQACIMTNASPFYTTTMVSGAPAPADGVHQLAAGVVWHVAYSITGTNPAALTAIPNSGSQGAAVAGTTLTFRVGEIQALAIGP
jgi:hypothetical protein